MIKRKLAILLLVLVVQKSIGRDEQWPKGFSEFKNIEQIEFCVPLPLAEYIEKESPQRAWHVFANKADPSHELSIQGKFKTYPQQALKEYIALRYTNDDVKQGQVIVRSKMNEQTNCYYETSYWHATEKTMRLAEMIWVRPDDVVVLQVDYALSDTTLWNQRLDFLINQDSYCP